MIDFSHWLLKTRKRDGCRILVDPADRNRVLYDYGPGVTARYGCSAQVVEMPRLELLAPDRETAARDAVRAGEMAAIRDAFEGAEGRFETATRR